MAHQLNGAQLAALLKYWRDPVIQGLVGLTTLGTLSTIVLCRVGITIDGKKLISRLAFSELSGYISTKNTANPSPIYPASDIFGPFVADQLSIANVTVHTDLPQLPAVLQNFVNISSNSSPYSRLHANTNAPASEAHTPTRVISDEAPSKVQEVSPTVDATSFSTLHGVLGCLAALFYNRLTQREGIQPQLTDAEVIAYLSLKRDEAVKDKQIVEGDLGRTEEKLIQEVVTGQESRAEFLQRLHTLITQCNSLAVRVRSLSSALRLLTQGREHSKELILKLIGSLMASQETETKHSDLCSLLLQLYEERFFRAQVLEEAEQSHMHDAQPTLHPADNQEFVQNLKLHSSPAPQIGPRSEVEQQRVDGNGHGHSSDQLPNGASIIQNTSSPEVQHCVDTIEKTNEESGDLEHAKYTLAPSTFPADQSTTAPSKAEKSEQLVLIQQQTGPIADLERDLKAAQLRHQNEVVALESRLQDSQSCVDAQHVDNSQDLDDGSDLPQLTPENETNGLKGKLQGAEGASVELDPELRDTEGTVDEPTESNDNVEPNTAHSWVLHLRNKIRTLEYDFDYARMSYENDVDGFLQEIDEWQEKLRETESRHQGEVTGMTTRLREKEDMLQSSTKAYNELTRKYADMEVAMMDLEAAKETSDMQLRQHDVIKYTTADHIDVTTVRMLEAERAALFKRVQQLLTDVKFLQDENDKVKHQHLDPYDNLENQDIANDTGNSPTDPQAIPGEHTSHAKPAHRINLRDHFQARNMARPACPDHQLMELQLPCYDPWYNGLQIPPPIQAPQRADRRGKPVEQCSLCHEWYTNRKLHHHLPACKAFFEYAVYCDGCGMVFVNNAAFRAQHLGVCGVYLGPWGSAAGVPQQQFGFDGATTAQRQNPGRALDSAVSGFRPGYPAHGSR